MKTVFCVTYGGGHVAIVDLIGRELQRRSRVRLRILALTSAYRGVVDQYSAGTVCRMSDFLGLFDDRLDDVLRYGQALAASNHDPSGRISRIESIAYLGLSYADLVADFGEAEAERRYALQARHAFLPVRTLKRIIQNERPDVVLSTTSPRCERAAILAANELAIPTVQILDLFGELHPLPAARHIVVADQDSIDSLRRQGVTDCEFHLFGQPTFEQTRREVSRISQAEIRRKLALGAETPVLLVATAAPCIHREDRTIERILPYEEFCGKLFPILDEVGRVMGARVLVRLHPNESPGQYESWFRRYPTLIHANPHLNLFESLAVADCVATPYSTVGVQAALCGRQVVTFRFSRDQFYPLPRLQRAPYRFANDFDELSRALQGGLNAPSSDSSFTMTESHSATAQIADLVESLALQ